MRRVAAVLAPKGAGQRDGIGAHGEVRVGRGAALRIDLAVANGEDERLVVELQLVRGVEPGTASRRNDARRARTRRSAGSSASSGGAPRNSKPTREELARVGAGPEAIRRTLATAGRTVLFSSLTVAAALGSLLVFPQRFLYSMGIGGVMVALLACGVALVVLPAVLALLGRRVNALAPRRLRRAAAAEARPAQRRVPAGPDQGGPRRRRVERRGGGARPRAQRAHRDRRGAAVLRRYELAARRTTSLPERRYPEARAARL